MDEWVEGEMEIKANLSLRLVEVEAELGNKMIKEKTDEHKTKGNQKNTNQKNI